VRAAAPLLLAGALAAGAAIRLAGGLPLVGTDLVFGAPAAAAPVARGSPEQAVLSFYERLRDGDWAGAWDLSVEPSWPGAARAAWGDEVAAAGRPSGWTTKDQFVRRCGEEIGSGIRLNGVAAGAGNARAAEAGREVAASLGAAGVRGVHVSGHMLGACLIYRWEKDLEVAEVGGRWKVLLPGTKAARAPFHDAWFSGVTLIGSLRGQAAPR
jgi:hypothetical protein